MKNPTHSLFALALAGSLLGVSTAQETLPTPAPVPAPAPGAPQDGPRGGNRDRTAELDTDGDGRVSQAEFLAGPRAQENAERATQMFGRLDANKDGYIDDADRAARDAANQNERQDLLRTRFAAIDTNKDGVISQEEFLAQPEPQRGEGRRGGWGGEGEGRRGRGGRGGDRGPRGEGGDRGPRPEAAPADTPAPPADAPQGV